MSKHPGKSRHIETDLIHAGAENHIAGAVVHPIFQSANYLMSEESSYDELRYIRLNNSPNHHLLHKRLATIENAEAALVASSGMAAITSTLLAILKSGDHMLSHKTLYGGTQMFLEEDALPLGIQHTSIDMADPSGWEAAVTPQTQLIYVEGISNPLMEVGDLRAVVDFARKHDLISVIDNTFLSPVNFRPVELGFDLVVHSATKYLNGHSDLVAGAVIGSTKLVDRVRVKMNRLGGSLDPHACFLLERGLKTLALRVARQGDNAMRLATFLESHKHVRQVHYPGLESHPGHAWAQELFDGFGGMLSFTLHDVAQVQAFLQGLQIPLHAASLGGIESLVVQPARSSHLGLKEEERQRLGILQELVRVSVGIENIDDLLADFAHALDNL